MKPSRLHLLNVGNVHILPILHYRMEFAHLVREGVERLQPDCIALELPPTLQEQFVRGVGRLPELSVLSCSSGDSDSYLLIEPADPLVEGGRLALEKDIPLHLVDPDLGGYPLHREPLPDSYALHRIGLGDYYGEYLKTTGAAPPSPSDLRREKGVAYRLQRLASRHRRILFLCGMYHADRVCAMLEEPQTVPLERVRREGVRLFNLHPDSAPEVLGEFPFLSAVYEMRRSSLPPEPAPSPPLRRRYRALELITGGKEQASEQEVLAASVLRGARGCGREGDMPDRQRCHLRLFEESARHYRQETGEPVHLWQKRAFFRFSRNYALLAGSLLPDLYQILSSARSCVDDNFAYSLWRLAGFYPWQREEAEIPTLRLRAEDLGKARSLRFRPRQGSGKGLSRLPFLQRRREKRPGEWLEGFDDPSICSFPPEDLVIEGYGNFLKAKGGRQLSEEQSRCEPFTSSLLDGIDLRETLRNLHEGRIYVRENRRVAGGVGSVVVIFDEDRGKGDYPYLMTWLGEHEQESDMAFYATTPTDNVVGPGICRCEYGGFVLSYPPRRMAEVWRDPDYLFARGKHEALLLAALDYSREKHVVYAAPHPPRSIFRQIASRLGRKIVYIPLGSLSPLKLKKLRIFHVLFGKDKRDIAREYIW